MVQVHCGNSWRPDMLLAVGCRLLFGLLVTGREIPSGTATPPPPPTHRQQSQELPGCQVKVKSPLSSPYHPPPHSAALGKVNASLGGGGERSQDNMDAVTQDRLRRVPVQLCGGWGRRGGSQCTREELIVGIIDRQLGHPLPTTPPHPQLPTVSRIDGVVIFVVVCIF